MPTVQGSAKLSVFSDVKAAPPCALVLFGATGDLAARKIAPALYHLRQAGYVGRRFAIVGVGRRDWTDQTLRDHVRKGVEAHNRGGEIDEALWAEFIDQWQYARVRADEPEDYRRLGETLGEVDATRQTGGNRLFYLAMPPALFAPTAEGLGAAGLQHPAAGGKFVRLIVEKPFGTDLTSARDLNRRLHETFAEPQIYRIDHYLGKETVQNLLVFRFANAVFEPIFNRRYVRSVQITTAETADMEGRRGPYYETAGALRDMMQNHMMQLLALTAMEAPTAMDGEAIRDEKVKVLRAIDALTHDEAATRTVRGQYGPDGARPGYCAESGVAPDSQVETFAAVKLFVNSWRWADVPFYLRTGKGLAKKASQIVIEFKREPLDLFDHVECDMRGANFLAIRIQPDEGIALRFDAKVPGPRMLMRPVSMDFQYGESFGAETPEAYEQLVLDAMRGEPSLFIRNDEVEAAWRIVDSIRAGWQGTGRPKLVEYPRGSWGPAEADGLFMDPYRKWQPL